MIRKVMYIIGIAIYSIVFGVTTQCFALSPLSKKEIHLFYEPYATMPALLEQIEFVKLPTSTKKIFAWHRFPNRDKKVDLISINATELKIPVVEGYYYPTKVHQYILDTAAQDNESTFVIHANINHIATLVIPLLQKLPKNRVKHLHLYEDGLCSVVQNSILNNKKDTNIYQKSVYQLKKAIDNPKEFNNYKTSDDDIWALSRLYPVTYHLGCKDLFLQRFKTMDKKIDIAFIDFRTIRHQLTEKQKTLLWDLLDFDYNKYNHLLSSKKYLLLLGGFFFGNQNLRLALHQFADNLQKGILIDLPKDLIWVYKPHPSYSSKEDLEYMQDLKEKWEFIPAQIPVETFILAGLEPTYIAGYPSSANYSFTNDQTTLLLERSNYQKVLKELGITDNKFISLQKLETQKGL